MTKIIRIGIDTSKSVFVLHGVDAAEQPVLRKKLRRSQVLEFFAQAGADEDRDGGLWRRALLGARAAGTGARGRSAAAAVRQALREAQQERRRRCRGDLRGDEPADDAVRAGQDDRAAGRADAGGRARRADRPPHAVEQHDPRLCGRVRADRRQGARQDRAAAGAHCGERGTARAGQGAVRRLRPGLRSAAAADHEDRSQADGLAHSTTS